MNEEKKQLTEEEKLKEQEEYQELLARKYKEKGFQQISLDEYEKIRAKKSKKSKVQIPTHMKFILGTPLIIIFCFGIFFIPYIVYLIFISSTTPPEKEKTRITYDDLLKAK